MFKNFLIGLAMVTTFVLVRYFYFKPMLVFGEDSPTFTAQDVNGKNISLKDYQGYYLLIDFWGSWCAPCRRENPILAMMYDKYKDRNFKSASGIKFLSIALEKDRESALNAIAKDGLVWPDHIIETQMLKSPMAILFGIKQVPTKFLIGPNGKIILSDPDIKELDDYLAKDRPIN
ncbi:MAG: TlpA disulfide reductase family protein [Saprospiraceae bacterium]